MEKWIKKIMQFGGLFLFMSCNQPVDVVTIDLSREEAEIVLDDEVRRAAERSILNMINVK